MIKSMRYLTITLSLILGLATSVSADNKSLKAGDIFVCQMDFHGRWDSDDKVLYKDSLKKFKLYADEKYIVFPESDHIFFDALFKIFWPQSEEGAVMANMNNASLTFYQGKMNIAYTDYNGGGATIISATCDRF